VRRGVRLPWQGYGRTARDDVAPGKDAFHVGGLRFLIGHDVAPLIEAEAGRGLRYDRVGLGAQRIDHGLALKLDELIQRHRLASTLFVRFAERHLLHPDSAHVIIGIGENFNGTMQKEEVDPFFPGMPQLLNPRRRFGLGAPVDAPHRRRPEPFRDAQTIHRCVAGTDDDNVVAHRNRGIEIGKAVAAHEG
jgi:hypothetical protein